MEGSAAISSHLVNLAHDGLESCETAGQEHASEGQGGLAVVAHGKEVIGGVGARNDDAALMIAFVVGVGVGITLGLVEVAVAAVAYGGCLDILLLVDYRVRGDLDDL